MSCHIHVHVMPYSRSRHAIFTFKSSHIHIGQISGIKDVALDRLQEKNSPVEKVRKKTSTAAGQGGTGKGRWEKAA